MPIYEYKCDECGKEMELLTSLASAHKKQQCPSCGKPGARRMLSVASIGNSSPAAGNRQGCELPTGCGCRGVNMGCGLD